jgi:hypothetical protein
MAEGFPFDFLICFFISRYQAFDSDSVFARKVKVLTEPVMLSVISRPSSLTLVLYESKLKKPSGLSPKKSV